MAPSPDNVSGKVIGQIALMQSVVAQLPDSKSIMTFVCQGLRDLPGVTQVTYELTDADAPKDEKNGSANLIHLEVKQAKNHYAVLMLEVDDCDVLSPYLPYIENFCSVLALIFEERRQRQLNEALRGNLEALVAERTWALEQEIQERKQIADSFQESQELLSRVLRAARSGTWDWDLASHEVHFDENYYRLAGYAPDAFPASYEEWKKRVHPDDLKYAEDKIAAYLSNEEPSYDIEFRFQRADTTWMWIRSQGIVSEYDDNDKPVRFSGLHTDIQDLKKAEEELLQAQNQLQHRMKMEAIGQLAGGVAHDFNNQLGGIMGFADMLLQRITDPSLNEYVRHILTCAERSADLTAQLLAFARKGQYESVPVDLRELVKDVVGILQHSIDKRIEIKCNLGERSLVTRGEATQLQNAILNLGLNARDAMSGAGTLTFSTGSVALDDDMIASLAYDVPAGVYHWVEVRDNGMGMSPEVAARVFEPFYTTKPVGEGTGMGLAAVYGMVQQHGGAIRLETTPGEGTAFTLYFKPAGVEISEQEQLDEPTKPGKGLVLVVDDEDVIRDLAVSMLGALGYTVTTVSDGTEAVEYYKDAWTKVDVVVLDVIMPRMNGRETYLALKEINPDVRVVVSSGYSSAEAVDSLRREGVNHFIDKPFRMKQLAAAVAEALGQ